MRKCQYIVRHTADKLGHDIMLGVCYDDGTKDLVAPPCRLTHVIWVYIKLPADKTSLKLTWSRMKPNNSEGAIS